MSEQGIKIDKKLLDIVYETYNKGLSKYLTANSAKRYNRSYGLHRFLHLDNIMGSWSDRT